MINLRKVGNIYLYTKTNVSNKSLWLALVEELKMAMTQELIFVN